MRSMAIVLCLVLAWSTAPAFADPGLADPNFSDPAASDAAPSDPASQVGDLEARIAALEDQRASISTRGPRAATITGAVLTGVGGGVALSAGILCAAAAAGSSTQCRVDNAVGIAAGGAVVAIAGIVTLMTGRSKLRERNRERDALQREIDALKQQRVGRVMPSIGVGMGPGNEPGIVLGWRF